MPPHTWNSFQKLIKQKTKFIVFVQHSCCGEILWAHHHTWARWREYQIYQTNTWRRNTAQRKMKNFVFRQDISMWKDISLLLCMDVCLKHVFELWFLFENGMPQTVPGQGYVRNTGWSSKNYETNWIVFSQYIIIANTGESEYFDWFFYQVGNLIFADQ